jgi:hypothetical protein
MARATIRYVDIIARRGLISEGDAKIWQEMKKLRDRAIHDLELNIAVTDALRYNDVADNVVHIVQLRRRG